jgi:fluoroquinolone transport system ATP-binding protein
MRQHCRAHEGVSDMIKVEGLYHSYNNDENYAVRDASFEIPKGEIFGFLGPSGAGKSTTQGILTGLLPLQRGNVTVAGYDVKNISRKMFNKIGMSFEQSNVYSKMTAKENLDFYKKLFDVETRDSEALIKLVGLDGKENIRAGEFSKGMKHRLTFARSMLNNPELWFLDEPTTGLDPAIAADIKDIIRGENQKGVTIFLTTHNMFIADELCDRVAFIIDGEIKLVDSPRNLKLAYGEQLVEVEYQKNGEIAKETFSTVLDEDKARLQTVIGTNQIQSMHTKEATLEEIFIKVTGRGLA